MTKFKPCPFCGSKRLDFEQDNYDSGGGWGQDEVFVCCLDCGAHGPRADQPNHKGKAKARALVKELWNKRSKG